MNSPFIVPSALAPLSPTLVEDEGVVELTQVLDGLHQPANLMVGILAIAGEHFHLPARKELLLVGR